MQNRYRMLKNTLVMAACLLQLAVAAQTTGKVKITLLSTMMADLKGVGEWGFAALVETDSGRILFDAGGRPGLVQQNARELKIDLAGIAPLILSHNHGDHTGGVADLRKQFKESGSFVTTYIGDRFFLRDTIPVGMRKNTDSLNYVQSGGRFVVVSGWKNVAPGVYLTGPVPRKYPEKNYPKGRTLLLSGVKVEDNIPEDMSLVLDTPEGLVLLSGCGHAGVVNTLEYVQQHFPHKKITALIGGFHLLDTDEQQLRWTAARIKDAGVRYFIGAHCTGINALYQIRQQTGLPNTQCVVGTVGMLYTLDRGIVPGWMK